MKFKYIFSGFSGLFIAFSILSYSQTNADSLYQNLYKKLITIDTNNIDAVNVNDINIDEIETKLNKYLYYKDDRELKNLKETLTYYRKAINQQNSKLDKLYYNKAENYLSLNDTINGIKYIEKSLEINPLNIWSLYKISEIWNNRNNSVKALKYLQNLICKTYPENSVKHNINLLASDVLMKLKKEIIFNLEKENYKIAEELLNTGIEFCKKTKLTKELSNFQNMNRDAKYGIYNSYINIGLSAIKNKRYELSENFIYSARKYRKENENEIGGINKEDSLLVILRDKYISTASKTNNPAKVNQYNIKIKSITDSIVDKSLIAKKEISREIIIIPKEEPELKLTLLTESTYDKNQILKSLKKAQTRLWVNDYYYADSILDYAKQSLLIKNDNDIGKGIEILEIKKEEKMCENLGRNYDIKMYEAEDLISKKMYADALSIMEKAVIETEEKNILKKVKCNPNLSKARNYIEKYRNCATYQTYLKESKTALNNSQYNDFITNYLNAESVYKTCPILQKNLRHTEFIKNTAVVSNELLLMDAIKYFLSKKDINNTYYLFEYLRNLAYPAEKTKELQIKFALEINNSEAGVIKEVYFKKWYKYLRKELKKMS